MFTPGGSGARARLAGSHRGRNGRAARGADAAVLLHRRLGGARARRVPARRRAAAGAVLEPPAVRLFEDASSFSFANPNAIRSPGAFIARPAGRLDVTTRRVAVIGLDGAIGGWTGLGGVAGAGAGAAQGSRLCACCSAPSWRRSSTDDFDWEAARALAELNTRLRPGDLLAGPPLESHQNVAQRAARAHDRRRRATARRERLVGQVPSPWGYPPGHAVLPAPRRRSAQAAHPVPRQRNPAHRRGDGARRLHRQRVDPLPPPVALPRAGGRASSSRSCATSGCRRPTSTG